jgi:predicted enzyme related to lactoylglutathione lyase
LLYFAEPLADGVPSHRRNQLGFTHLSFQVDDVEGVAGRLVELGGTIIPSTRAVLGVPVVFLADPDGTRVELMGLSQG